MKKTYLQRAASALMGAMLLAGILGTPAAAVQKQVDAYGRDFTRVEGGTYFSERTGESTYRNGSIRMSVRKITAASTSWNITRRLPPARRGIITPTTACCAESGS